MTKSRFILFVILAAAIGAFFVFDLGRYVSLDELRAQQDAIIAYRDENTFEAGLVFFDV